MRVLRSWAIRDGGTRQILCLDGPNDGGPWVTSEGYPALGCFPNGCHILRDVGEMKGGGYVAANVVHCDCDQEARQCGPMK